MVTGTGKQYPTLDSRAEEEMISPSEVAHLFGVNPKTVTRWAKDGRIRATRTLGGHRRYRVCDVRLALNNLTNTP